MTDLDYFKLWFKEPLKTLSDNKHAGFIMLMTAFPILERYLRGKSGVREPLPLSDPFFREFQSMFPQLQDLKLAEECWDIYRNGLLHQVTPFQKEKRRKHGGGVMPWGEVTSRGPLLEYDAAAPKFTINAPAFAKKVLEEVEQHFPTYEVGSPLPVGTLQGPTGPQYRPPRRTNP